MRVRLFVHRLLSLLISASLLLTPAGTQAARLPQTDTPQVPQADSLRYAQMTDPVALTGQVTEGKAAAALTFNDPLYAQQWHLGATNVPQAWQWLTDNGLPAGGSRDLRPKPNGGFTCQSPFDRVASSSLIPGILHEKEACNLWFVSLFLSEPIRSSSYQRTRQ